MWSWHYINTLIIIIIIINYSESTAGSYRCSGSEFQTVGLETENARVPKVLRQTRGTDSWWHLADLRCWRPGTSETGTQYSWYMFVEASCFGFLCVIMTLFAMLSSQPDLIFPTVNVDLDIQGTSGWTTLRRLKTVLLLKNGDTVFIVIIVLEQWCSPCWLCRLLLLIMMMMMMMPCWIVSGDDGWQGGIDPSECRPAVAC